MEQFFYTASLLMMMYNFYLIIFFLILLNVYVIKVSFLVYYSQAFQHFLTNSIWCHCISALLILLSTKCNL